MPFDWLETSLYSPIQPRLIFTSYRQTAPIRPSFSIFIKYVAVVDVGWIDCRWHATRSSFHTHTHIHIHICIGFDFFHFALHGAFTVPLHRMAAPEREQWYQFKHSELCRNKVFALSLTLSALSSQSHSLASLHNYCILNSRTFKKMKQFDQRQRRRPKSNNSQRLALERRKNCETRCVRLCFSLCLSPPFFFSEVCKAKQAATMLTTMLRKQNAFGITNIMRASLQITSACYIVKLVWLFANNKLRNGKI